MIDTGHVLAGVLSVADPAVERVLRQLGADVVRLRLELGNAPAA